MNQQIISYLQQNKAAYSKEVLVQQLRTSGYGENDIQEAVSAVYATELQSIDAPIPTPIFNNTATPMQNFGQPEYANLGKRITGGIIDCVALIVIFVIFGIFFGTTSGGTVSVEGFPALVLFILMFGYFIAMEALAGKTIGKYITKTRVVNEVGGNISWNQSVKRNLMRIVDALFIYLVGIIAIASSNKKQRLGDKVAKTYVIKD